MDAAGNGLWRAIEMKTDKRKSRSRGFTLIEMMVVIVIILILSGIVLKVATLAGRKGATSQCEAMGQRQNRPSLFT